MFPPDQENILKVTAFSAPAKSQWECMLEGFQFFKRKSTAIANRAVAAAVPSRYFNDSYFFFLTSLN